MIQNNRLKLSPKHIKKYLTLILGNDLDLSSVTKYQPLIDHDQYYMNQRFYNVFLSVLSMNIAYNLYCYSMYFEWGCPMFCPPDPKLHSFQEVAQWNMIEEGSENKNQLGNQ